MKIAYKPHATPSVARRSHGFRRSRTITVIVNGQPRIMKIPSERSVEALREYARSGKITVD